MIFKPGLWRRRSTQLVEITVTAVNQDWIGAKGSVLASIPKNVVRSASCARVEADAWIFVEAILKDQYGSKIGRVP